MKIKNLAFLLFLTTLIFSGCENKGKIDEAVIVKEKATKTADKQKETPQIPTFNLKTHDGKDITILADVKTGWKFKGLENKIILVDFFGTWCPPCKAEIPHLNNIREEFKNDFEILGIDIGQRDGSITDPTELKEFIKEFKIKYPITTDGDNRTLFNAVIELNKSGSIPFMILFDKKGQYMTHYVGMVPEEMLKSDINKVLGK